MTRPVEEHDLRMPEFRHVKPEELEFRADGKIVRKDRFETGIRRIAGMVIGGRDYEIDDVIGAVRKLVELEESIQEAAADDIWETIKTDFAYELF